MSDLCFLFAVPEWQVPGNQCDTKQCFVFGQTVLAAVTRVLSEREKVFTISPKEERAREREICWSRSPKDGERDVQRSSSLACCEKTATCVVKHAFYY